MNHETILLELDEDYLAKQYNEVEKWFEHVWAIQTALETSISKAIPEIKEPHIREAMEKMLESNKHHSKSLDELFVAIQRSPNKRTDKMMGSVMASLQKNMVHLQDVIGGSGGSWVHLHVLLLVNQQAMGAFAVAEQLGLALGMKEIVSIAFPIVHEKTMHQLLLQEYMLEMAPISILYKEDI
jgi:hypothetical protein